jgi:hypothetical protein
MVLVTREQSSADVFVAESLQQILAVEQHGEELCLGGGQGTQATVGATLASVVASQLNGPYCNDAEGVASQLNGPYCNDAEGRVIIPWFLAGNLA